MPNERMTVPTITLPDGSQRSFDQPVTGFELAGDIGETPSESGVGNSGGWQIAGSRSDN